MNVCMHVRVCNDTFTSCNDFNNMQNAVIMALKEQNIVLLLQRSFFLARLGYCSQHRLLNSNKENCFYEAMKLLRESESVRSLLPDDNAYWLNAAPVSLS